MENKTNTLLERQSETKRAGKIHISRIDAIKDVIRRESEKST